MSLKSSLLSLSGKRSFETLDLPEPIGKVRMRTLTVAESIAIDTYLFDETGKPIAGRQQYANAKRLAMSIVDEQGNPEFTDEDLAALALLPDAVQAVLMTKFWEMRSPGYLETFLKNVQAAA